MMPKGFSRKVSQEKQFCRLAILCNTSYKLHHFLARQSKAGIVSASLKLFVPILSNSDKF